MLEEILRHILPKKRHKAEEDVRAKRKQQTAQFSSDLERLTETITDKNVHKASREFYALVRRAMKEALQLDYQATLEEIQREAEKYKHYPADLREELTIFLNDVALMEYDYPDYRDILKEKLHEQEGLLRKYMRDLEAEGGDRIKESTKKKITRLVSETVPHSDKDMLLRLMGRFKQLLHKVF